MLFYHFGEHEPWMIHTQVSSHIKLLWRERQAVLSKNESAKVKADDQWR